MTSVQPNLALLFSAPAYNDPSRSLIALNSILSAADATSTGSDQNNGQITQTEIHSLVTNLTADSGALSTLITNASDFGGALGGFFGKILNVVKTQVDKQLSSATLLDTNFGALVAKDSNGNPLTDSNGNQYMNKDSLAKVAANDADPNNPDDVNRQFLTDVDLGIAPTLGDQTGIFYQFAKDADQTGKSFDVTIAGKKFHLDFGDGKLTKDEANTEINNLTTDDNTQKAIIANTDNSHSAADIAAAKVKDYQDQSEILAGNYIVAHMQNGTGGFVNWDDTNHAFVSYNLDPTKLTSPPTSLNQVLDTSELFATADRDQNINKLNAADFA